MLRKFRDLIICTLFRRLRKLRKFRDVVIHTFVPEVVEAPQFLRFYILYLISDPEFVQVPRFYFLYLINVQEIKEVQQVP